MHTPGRVRAPVNPLPRIESSVLRRVPTRDDSSFMCFPFYAVSVLLVVRVRVRVCCLV